MPDLHQVRTDLEHRMAMHRPGQVTWPEPRLGRECRDCKHFDTDKENADGWAPCALAEVFTGKVGKKFPPSAVACPQFCEKGGLL